MQTAGFVLAGGQSTRMGRDKALLGCGSLPLIKEVAARVAVVAQNVALIGSLERYGRLGFDCFPDLRPNGGPLAGIETALAARRAEYNLVVACDMPDLRTGWLRALLATSKQTGALCTAARDATGRIHPLCAVYRAGCLPAVRSALDAGRLKLLAFLEDLNAITIDIGGKLWNLNTPRDWDAWRRERHAASIAGCNDA